MPVLRHIALATQSPFTTADFYRTAFGWREAGRSANAVFLTDGWVNLAIIRFSTDQLGRGMDYVGLHHFGVLVDDLAQWNRRLEAAGSRCFMKPPPGNGDFNYEYKFHGPDNVVFDLSEHAWSGTPALHEQLSAASQGGTTMPKIRHIALATNDPEATAEFYKKAFDFKEVERRESYLAKGIFLTDGTLNLAILKFQNVDQLGKGLDYVGLHHFGILVDDLDEYTRRLEAMGTPCFMKPPEGDKASNFEVKFRGPDGVVFDIAEHMWRIETRENQADAGTPAAQTPNPAVAK
jgi:catechol 2,3-dioxygenase-like lactoylglutathione lyase family enzyme